ncbi:MAG TPA: SAM-dependent methyltransferase [Caulobacteraceae bacterium]|jgi:methyltransferase (TIGR00027 family)|nr:SAM-dependent methyltransferase [Caulobacteraceae bacterium]
MEPGQPSQTALRAAAHRAAHQTLDGGVIFADPLATAVLGATAAEIFGDQLNKPANRSMRGFIAARSRFAEESLAAAVARSVRQYVVLGAGLDTFAHRNPFADQGLRVFEVDHPATQGWKQRRLADAGLAAPASLTFAPVDFERETLAAGLAAAGFDAAAPAFFSWLGVIVYLTRPAVMETLGFVASLAGGGEVVFDYGVPISSYPSDRQAYQARRAAYVAAMGEPWRSRFTPGDLAAMLGGLGFTELEDLGPAAIAGRFYGVGRPDGPGGHFMRASSPGFPTP